MQIIFYNISNKKRIVFFKPLLELLTFKLDCDFYGLKNFVE